MKLKVGMTLAPRLKPEVNQTIKSFRNAGFKNKIDIYAEPGEYEIKDKNINLYIHEEKKGCFKNFDYTLKKLLETKADYYLLMQDDFLIDKDCKNKIEQIIFLKGQDFGFISLNTRQYSNYFNKEIYKEGRNQNILGRLFSPAFFLFSRKGAKQIIKHSFYENHLDNYDKNKQIDGCIGETVKQLGLEMYNHNPSLSIQRGETSTIGHNPRFIQNELGYKECEKVIGGICSIPSREGSLKIVLKSILLQVNKLYISLNGYKKIPDRLKEYKKYFDIDIRKTDNKRGDIEKFYGVDKENGYYFCFDDDLEYKPTYVKEYLRKIEQYGRKAIIGIHGSRVIKPIEGYYKSRKVYHFNQDQSKDYEVNILGTGTIGFHTDTIRPNINGRTQSNATDLLLGIECNNKDIRMINISHSKERIKEIKGSQTESIRATKRKNDEIETELAKSTNWSIKKRESKDNIEIKKTQDRVKVKFLRPLYPYKSGEIAYITKQIAEYHKKRLQVLTN